MLRVLQGTHIENQGSAVNKRPKLQSENVLKSRATTFIFDAHGAVSLPQHISPAMLLPVREISENWKAEVKHTTNSVDLTAKLLNLLSS